MQRWIIRAVLWAPVAAAAVFLLVILANFGEIRDGLASHADYASTPVLAELITKAPPGSTLALGDYAWYEAFWLLRATSWLPSHFFFWELVPFVLWGAAALLAGFSARRISGSRWAGATALALVICGGVAMRGTLWSLNTHGPAAFHVALIAAALMLAVSSPRWTRGLRGWGGALGLALATMIGVTDPLVAAVGLGPLLATGVVLWFWRGQAAVLQLGVFVSAIAIVGAKLLDRLAVDALITWTHKPLNFVAVDGIIGHLNLLPGAVARLASVNPFGAAIGPQGAIGMAAALTALLAGIVVLQVSVRQFKRAVWPERFGLATAGVVPVAAPGSAATPHPADAETEVVVRERDGEPESVDAQPVDAEPVDAEPVDAEPVDTEAVFIAGLVFWFSVIVINLAAFVFTTAAFDINGARYLVSGWVGICVLIPVLGVRTDLRWLAGLTATVLCVGSLYGLIKHPDPTYEAKFITPAQSEQIEQFVKANDASQGYGGFWEAIPITWHTRFGIQASPILPCGGDNCRFYQHNISSWYAPKPGRSFLVTGGGNPLQPVVDPDYGTPVATTKVGEFTVNVYDHDIAAQLG